MMKFRSDLGGFPKLGVPYWGPTLRESYYLGGSILESLIFGVEDQRVRGAAIWDVEGRGPAF